MFIISSKFLNEVKRLANKRIVLCFLMAFDILFCIVNIFKQLLLVGAIFLLLNFLYILVSNKKNIFYLLFFLYPLARVLKFPNFGTSILTILLALSYFIFAARFFVKKEKLTKPKLITSILFGLYVLLTLIVSFINKGFELNALLSYYLYLAYPFIAFAIIKNDNELDGTNNLIFCMTSYLIGILITIVFYKIIPNGSAMLTRIGVKIFEMGTAGIRFTPLTDDPNYGAALILLIGCIFIIAKKTKRQKTVGYPILLSCFGLSCLSLSKMFIGCIVILFFCWLISFMFKTKSLIINSSLLLFVVIGIIVFLSSSFGTSLIIRTIGTTDGISLNRITSGRTDIFGEYSSYILSKPLALLFGKGPLFVDESTFSAGEHNTFTKNVFGSGLIGVTIMLVAFYIMMQNRFDKIKEFPKNSYFVGLILCLLICCMSLGIAPSTVFPIFVVAFQFTIIDNTSVHSVLLSSVWEEITI